MPTLTEPALAAITRLVGNRAWVEAVLAPKPQETKYSPAKDQMVHPDPEMAAWIEEVREYELAKKQGHPAPRVDRLPRGRVDPRAAQLRSQHYEYPDTTFRTLPGGAALPSPQNWNTNTVTSDLTEESLLEAMRMMLDSEAFASFPGAIANPGSLGEVTQGTTATQVRMQEAEAAARLARLQRASEPVQAQLNSMWDQAYRALRRQMELEARSPIYQSWGLAFPLQGNSVIVTDDVT